MSLIFKPGSISHTSSKTLHTTPHTKTLQDYVRPLLIVTTRSSLQMDVVEYGLGYLLEAIRYGAIVLQEQEFQEFLSRTECERLPELFTVYLHVKSIDDIVRLVQSYGEFRTLTHEGHLTFKDISAHKVGPEAVRPPHAKTTSGRDLYRTFLQIFESLRPHTSKTAHINKVIPERHDGGDHEFHTVEKREWIGLQPLNTATYTQPTATAPSLPPDPPTYRSESVTPLPEFDLDHDRTPDNNSYQSYHGPNCDENVHPIIQPTFIECMRLCFCGIGYRGMNPHEPGLTQSARVSTSAARLYGQTRLTLDEIIRRGYIPRNYIINKVSYAISNVNMRPKDDERARFLLTLLDKDHYIGMNLLTIGETIGEQLIVECLITVLRMQLFESSQYRKLPRSTVIRIFVRGPKCSQCKFDELTKGEGSSWHFHALVLTNVSKSHVQSARRVMLNALSGMKRSYYIRNDKIYHLKE
ncbi:hypothetical protein [Operophtera brumata reovirus]|uniref:hypothetical protein n=1 Tax=Operophtera brumata reovirus TaxID=352248 RepID=UPI00005D683F|nr:hypothetical protein [Operophtera brumata reovirus]ABB17214.1 unknown [Operophtera brumata reovirus]